MCWIQFLGQKLWLPEVPSLPGAGLSSGRALLIPRFTWRRFLFPDVVIAGWENCLSSSHCAIFQLLRQWLFNTTSWHWHHDTNIFYGQLQQLPAGALPYEVSNFINHIESRQKQLGQRRQVSSRAWHIFYRKRLLLMIER